jgi:diguanylate cyclase (GGDEF)-like protein
MTSAAVRAHGSAVHAPGPAPDGGTASRRWLGALVAGLAVCAALLAHAAGRLPGAPAAGHGEQLALLALLVLTGFLSLDFRVGTSANRVDLVDAALAAALLALPGPRLVAAVLVAKACVLVSRSVARDKIVFNLAQWACAAAAGALVVAAARDAGPVSARDLLVVPVALLVVALLNAGSVLLVMTLVGRSDPRGGSPRRLVRGMLAGGLLNFVLGLVVAALWTAGTQARLAVPLVLLGVHVATGLWAQQRAGRSRLAGLQRASATLAGPDELVVALPVFLEQLRSAFECEAVELRLLDGARGSPLRLTAGRDLGEQATGALLETLRQGGGGVRLAGGPGAGWRDCLAAPVRFRGSVVGALSTFDREGWDGFEHGELPVLEAAAGVLAEALHRDELAQVLHAERAALSASEVRWRALARVLELVARGTGLPETLAPLARTVEEQSVAGRCVVVVRTPGEDAIVSAPSLPPAATRAVERLLTPGGSARAAIDTACETDVELLPVGDAREALRSAGVRTLRSWPLLCTPGVGATGAVVLLYPTSGHFPEDHALASGAARVGGLAVDHVLVQRRLAHQADHDALTDLPNRSAFLDRLSRALGSTERSDRWALVLFLDLDRFKVVNDSLGHRAGDALLCAVAARLRTAVRPGDTVARFGGDEFTMLCEEVEDEAHALRVVDRVRAALEQPFPLGDGELFATASIGIALGRGRGETPETLVQNADAAMYRAKDRGGNCFEVFDEAMRDRAVRRLATSSALHRAVEREEFHVVYQPTVRLATGEVDGVEALLRWDRPDHGVVAPGDFVPLAEENGLIVPIGAYVLEQACAQAHRWSVATGSGAGPSVAVNLSARQLVDPGLLPLVRGAIERSGVDPASISLEITESVLMGDVAASGSVLAELKALGLRLYVDDFGTGYSSLTYLQRFPVDGVKVDRSFVAGLGTHDDAEAIVRAVIGLAHGLGLVAVAEGVETQQQLDRLIDLRCDVAQGYHLGRPAAADLVRLGSPA